VARTRVLIDRRPELYDAAVAVLGASSGRDSLGAAGVATALEAPARGGAIPQTSQ
jgi:hypothetical protein